MLCLIVIRYFISNIDGKFEFDIHVVNAGFRNPIFINTLIWAFSNPLSPFNFVGYGDTSSTVEVRISKYDYLGYMLCVADAEDHPEVAVKQYDFDFGQLLIF